jgi:hypothetical protein
MRIARLVVLSLATLLALPAACSSSSSGRDQGPSGDTGPSDGGATDLAAPDAAVTADAPGAGDGAGADAVDLGIGDPTEPCPWAPLQCSSSASGCSCTRACEGHVYVMTCSGSACSCTTDGVGSGATGVSATCGDGRSLSTAFANGCSYPGVAPGAPNSADCAGATPQQAFTPGGCLYSKVCGGHEYHLSCPSGFPCYCNMDGLFTATSASASCQDATSLDSAFTQDCAFP